ncbi:putative polysaccharide biosynthesis protein [Jeotgalibaca caeni]|uniref:putative polysaccharide biosynthesis protein n=1 Tax=Jeotgalibaca caeni TaxID=3028623 RepID=UPI00237E8D49|nr:polysaccharide biosynthesis protein [Jeotgalibaca caeni]MDE1549315.1 polysaccharide biosynthesis protein [Jeotgalibaca caeni]
MKNEQVKQMMNGAFLLSLAAFIAKILSAVYRVPFQNMVGNTGFYVYQQVYPLYGIGMTFALSGFPVFFSKRIASVAEAEHKQLVRDSLMILSLFSLAIFGLLYGFAPFIAERMGDVLLAPIIQSVSWMFLFMPVLATFRGFFQGSYRMKPTAVSQVSEQLIRVLVILAAAFWFTRSNTMNLYEMGARAMSGAAIGALVSAALLGWWMRKEMPMKELRVQKGSSRNTFFSLLRGYATEGTVICLLTSILVLFQLVDSFTLYKGLVENGWVEETAKSLKGIYDRGQPLVQLGMVVGTGFSASFIPLMSRAYLAERRDEFHRAARSLIRITAAFSFAAVAGLLAILPEVNVMLFGDGDGNAVLSVYIISIAIASVMMAYHSILQSYQQYRLTLYALGLGIFVKYVMNQLLVNYWDTLGASAATLLGLLAMVWLMGRNLPLSLKGVWQKDRFGFKITGGAFLLFGGAIFTKTMLRMLFFPELTRTSAMIVAICTVLIGVLLFGVYLLKVKVFTIREWLSLPLGKKILRFRGKE